MKMLLRLLVGALGGMSATGPMTIAMIWLHRILPTRERYSLPPREIIVHLAEKAGVLDRQRRLSRERFEQLVHFGAKFAGGFSPNDQGADDAIFSQQGNGQARAKPKAR